MQNIVPERTIEISSIIVVTYLHHSLEFEMHNISIMTSIVLKTFYYDTYEWLYYHTQFVEA